MTKLRLISCTLALLGGAVGFPGTAAAKPLLIIHTNDLHSHFEPVASVEAGGYAAVKAVIDQLKSQAKAQGIDTLTLDAGDFSEGTEYFLADGGKRSWELIDHMGYDAIAIGNHDWLIGLDGMEAILGAIDPSTPFLSANLMFDPSYENLSKHVLPHLSLIRSGAKIAIVGLSTDELIYKWRVKEGGFISSVTDAAKSELAQLRPAADYVIALTHIGVDADQDLASQVPGIDLIVGGHSHTVLETPVIAGAPSGASVPIVQTGYAGRYVGRLLVDLVPGKPLRILDYRLIPVAAQSARDPQIANEVSQARAELEAQYGKSWLGEVLVQSAVPLTSPSDGPTPWGKIYARAMMDAVGADAAVDVGSFFGDGHAAGPITRENLFQFYPRTFDPAHPYGWNVWTVHCPGWLLKLILKEAAKNGSYMSTAGAADGRLHDLKIYKLAVSEGIGRGGTDLSVLIKMVLEPQNREIPIWQAVEDELKTLGGPAGVISPAQFDDPASGSGSGAIATPSS